MPARPTRPTLVLLLAALACTGSGPGGDSAPTRPSAPGDPATPVAGTQLYTFHATESLTGGMVQQATVLAGMATGVTDGGGRVSFRLRPGPLELHAAHPDYATYSALVTLPHAGGLVVLAGLGVPDTDLYAAVVALAVILTLILQAVPAAWLAERLGLIEPAPGAASDAAGA